VLNIFMLKLIVALGYHTL